MFTITLIDDF